MLDTLNIECLLEAIDDYVEASAEERSERDRYDVYSWGYHGSPFIERKARCAARVKERFEKCVADAVDNIDEQP